MIKLNKIKTINYSDDQLLDSKLINSIRKDILCGDTIVLKKAFDLELIQKLKGYLTSVGRNSIPNYEMIAEGSPNFHRINDWDERAYVGGCFHQFTFFPWNQDYFRLFEKSRKIFQLKNLVNNQEKNKFLGRTPDDDCVARLSFQFYPGGAGALNKHSDPVDHHQLTVPLLIMSKKGDEFTTGGLFVENQKNEHIFIDDLCDIGDVVLFNAQVPHGVATIDPDKALNWLNFEGRWMMIFATNKLASNDSISNAIDLSSK